LASLLVAGALACGCGEAAAPHKPAKPKATTTVSRASFDPLVAMHASEATGTATYCSAGRQEREYVKWFNENSTEFEHMDFVDLGNAGDPRKRIEAGLRSGRCDAALVFSAWVPKLATDGALLDLTKYAHVRRSEFFPATLAVNAYRGHQWAIPREVGVGVLYVRSDQAARPPQSWDALLTDKRPSRRVAVAGDGGEATADLFVNLLYAGGGRIVGPGGHSAAGGPAGRRALDLLLQGWAGGTIRTTPDESYAEVVQDFRRGEEAFLPTESRVASFVLGARKVDATVTQVPHAAGRPPRPLVDTISVAVSAKASNRGMAIHYLNWLSSPWVMQNAADWDQASPLRESYGKGPNSAVDKLEGADAIREALEHAVPYPAAPALTAIGVAIGRNVHRAVTGSVTAQQALRNMDEEINAALAGDAAGDAS